MVKDHPEAHDAVVGPQAGLRQEKQPENDRRQGDSPAHQHEPPQLHPRGPGHRDKDHHIDDAHAEVAADDGDEAQHKDRVPADLNDGGNGADVQPPVLYFYDLEGQKEDKGNFDDLIGLDIHRKAGDNAGEDQPVQVAGVVVLPQGSEEEEHKEDVEGQNGLPALFQKELKIHKGEQHIGRRPQKDGHKLDEHEAHPPRLAEVLRSRVDQGQPEGWPPDTEPAGSRRPF